MKLLDAIKKADIRATNMDRWLVWDWENDTFKVYERKRYKRKTRVIISTHDEELAVSYLIDEDKY